MNKKTFSTIIFISSFLILLFSILGLIMLNLNYLTVSSNTYFPEFFNPLYVGVNFSGYQLIFNNNGMQFVIEPLLHFIFNILFLIGSLVFIVVLSINYFTKDGSKEIEIKHSEANNKKKNYKKIIILLSIILGLIAILFMVFGCLGLYGGTSGTTYHIGIAKILAGFLLGFNFLILAFALDVFLYYKSLMSA